MVVTLYIRLHLFIMSGEKCHISKHLPLCLNNSCRLRLCPHREILLSDEVHVVEDDGLTGTLGIVGAEDQNAFTTE